MDFFRAVFLICLCSGVQSEGSDPYHILQPTDYCNLNKGDVQAMTNYVKVGQNTLASDLAISKDLKKTDINIFVTNAELSVETAIDDDIINANMHFDAVCFAPLSKCDKALPKCLVNEPSVSCSALRQIPEFRKCQTSRAPDYDAIIKELTDNYQVLVTGSTDAQAKFISLCSNADIQSMPGIVDAYMQANVYRYKAQYASFALRKEAELRFNKINAEIRICICEKKAKLAASLAQTLYNIKNCLLGVATS